MNPSGYFLALSKGCVLQLCAGDGVNGAFCGSVDCGNICFCHNVNVQQFGDVSPAGKRTGGQAGRTSCRRAGRISVPVEHLGKFTQLCPPPPLLPCAALKTIYIISNDFPLLLTPSLRCWPAISTSMFCLEISAQAKVRLS